mmetsp:Transcript_22269/g.74944  ORF Transcript_22269/g.74944 Transcript_22269/m.74944 type:complete len:300 (-) Transcript_22269:57-956(-)
MPVARLMPHTSITVTDTAGGAEASAWEGKWRRARRKAREELCMPPWRASTRASGAGMRAARPKAKAAPEHRAWKAATQAVRVTKASRPTDSRMIGAMSAVPDPANSVAITAANAGLIAATLARAAGKVRLKRNPSTRGTRTTWPVVRDMPTASTATWAPPAKTLVKRGVSTKEVRFSRVVTVTQRATSARARRAATEAAWAAGAAARSTRPVRASLLRRKARPRARARGALITRCASMPRATLRLPSRSTLPKSSNRRVTDMLSIMAPRPSVYREPENQAYRDGQMTALAEASVIQRGK